MYLVMEVNINTHLVMDHRDTGTAPVSIIYETLWYAAVSAECRRIGAYTDDPNGCRLTPMLDEDVIHKLPSYNGGS